MRTFGNIGPHQSSTEAACATGYDNASAGKAVRGLSLIHILSGNNRIEELCAKEDIRDCLRRYARGVDRADRDLLKGTYWPEATESHAGRFEGLAHDFVEGVLPQLLEGKGLAQKLLGQSYIELLGEHANVETYFFSYNRIKNKMCIRDSSESRY